MSDMPHKILIVSVILGVLSIRLAVGQDFEQFIGGDSVLDSIVLTNQQDSLGVTYDTDSAIVVPQNLKNILESIMTESDEKSEQEIGLEIDGLVVDQTRTKAGQDFYDHFYRNWEAPPEASNYTITIREMPFRIRMTQVIIKINDNEVFRQVLQPRNDYIVMLADYAIARCQQFLLNYEEILRQLGGDDQSGTGIF